MSHIVTIKTEIRNVGALHAACSRLGLKPPIQETAQLFASKATGHCVQLPGWRYPVVCEVASGQVIFDDFSGRWGERRELDRLLQAYAAEMTKLEARRKGHSVTEQSLPDGSIKLTIQVGDTNAND